MILLFSTACRDDLIQVRNEVPETRFWERRNSIVGILLTFTTFQLSSSHTYRASRPVTSPLLTFRRRNFLLNFSTPCIQNVNNTGTKKGSFMK